jgi:hypothetical protein
LLHYRPKDNAEGVITTLAGAGAEGYEDGPANKARFRGPKGIRCDKSGNFFVVDTENHPAHHAKSIMLVSLP